MSLHLRKKFQIFWKWSLYFGCVFEGDGEISDLVGVPSDQRASHQQVTVCNTEFNRLASHNYVIVTGELGFAPPSA